MVIKLIKKIVIGTPEFAVPILDTLIKTSEVVLVVTKPDKYVGRKKILTPSPVKEFALKHNIPVLEPLKIKEDYEYLKKYQPDLIVTCAYGQILPKEILDLPPLGCINVHASLLPKYRGGAPIHYALLNGEEKTGITIYYMDTNLDTGDIISSASIPIKDDDNIITLSNKLSFLASNLLADTLPTIINKTCKREPQNNNEATYAYTIKREEEHLDFTKTAKEVSNRVRALYPSSYFLLNNEEVKVLSGIIGEDSPNPPKSIILKKDALGITCQDKVYYITELKPFGKKAMNIKDYLNGINKDKLINSIIK